MLRSISYYHVQSHHGDDYELQSRESGGGEGYMPPMLSLNKFAMILPTAMPTRSSTRDTRGLEEQGPYQNVFTKR